MIESLIFDWSGTLADDFHATLEATNSVLVQLGGAPVDAATYRRDFVLPVMGFYAGRLPGKTLAEIDGAFFEAMAHQDAAHRLYDGAEALLRTAKARGKRLFILSTMSPEILTQALSALGIADLFEGVYGGAADKSLVMPQLIAENDLQPDRCVFAGDTPHDMEVGRSSGVCLAASLYGYASKEKMMATRPDLAMESLLDFSTALDRDHMIDTQKIVVATVGGVVSRPDGKILLVRTKKWSNSFGIPGGKIDYGETMLEAYEREIKEETNLDITDSQFVMIQDCIESKEFVKPRHFLLINYVSKTARPEDLSTNYEIEETKWVDVKSAFDLKLNKPTELVLREAIRLGLLQLDGASS